MTREAMWILMSRARPVDPQRLARLAGLLDGQEGADLRPGDVGAKAPHYKPYIAELAGWGSELTPTDISLGMKLAVAFNPYHIETVVRDAIGLVVAKGGSPSSLHSRQKCGIVLGVFECLLLLEQLDELSPDNEIKLLEEMDGYMPALMEALLTSPNLALDDTELNLWYDQYKGQLSKAVKSYARSTVLDARRETVVHLMQYVSQTVNYPTRLAGSEYSAGQLTSDFGYDVLDIFWWAEVGRRSIREKLSMI